VNLLFLLLFSTASLFGATLDTSQGVVIDKPIANLPHALASWGDKHLFATLDYPKITKRTYENDTFGMLAALRQSDAPYLTLTLVDEASQTTRTLPSTITQSKAIKAIFLPSGALIVASLDYHGQLTVARWEGTYARATVTQVESSNTIDIVNIHPHYDAFAIVTLHDHTQDKLQHFARGNARIGFELALFDASLNRTAQHFIGEAHHRHFVDSCYSPSTHRYLFATFENNLSLYSFDKTLQTITPSTHAIDANTSLLGLVCESKNALATSKGLLSIDDNTLRSYALPLEQSIEQAYQLPDNGWVWVWHTPSAQGDIDAHVMRTNAAFKPLWHHWLSTPYNDRFETLQIDQSQGVTLHGSTYDAQTMQLFALRLDSAGKMMQKRATVDLKAHFFQTLLAQCTKNNLPITHIDNTTLRIDLPYAQGEETLSSIDEAKLKTFWKLFVQTLQNPAFRDAIDNIRIVGATSSEWNNHPDASRHINNSALSLARGQNMLSLLYQNALPSDIEAWMRKHISVEGIAMTRPIVNHEKLENFSASRRNELIIIWKP